MLKYAFTCLTLILGCLWISAGAKETEHSIYYVPFGAETFVAVTVDNIDECYNRYSDVPLNNPEMREVLSLLSSGSHGVFDREMVRAKLRGGDSRWIYVDNFGGIRMGTSETKLSSVQFAHLKHVLDRITSKRRRAYNSR